MRSAKRTVKTAGEIVEHLVCTRHLRRERAEDPGSETLLTECWDQAHIWRMGRGHRGAPSRQGELDQMRSDRSERSSLGNEKWKNPARDSSEICSEW